VLPIFGGRREDARSAAVSEQFDTPTTPYTEPASSAFSGEACDLLGATVRDYLRSGGMPEELARVTARLCREAHARGLSADETLTEIRATLAKVFSDCALTSTDRAALVALAIDECVHAFYHGQRSKT
jgi:hypothetical protein